MKTYCVRQKKKTDCLPGSETIRTTRNGRRMLVCECAECGATKTQFVAGQSGGALKRDFACGYNLQGKRPGTKEECFRTGRIGYWGLNQLDDGEIDGLIYDRTIDRNRKARERRQAKKGALVEYKPPVKSRKKKPIVAPPELIKMLSPAEYMEMRKPKISGLIGYDPGKKSRKGKRRPGKKMPSELSLADLPPWVVRRDLDEGFEDVMKWRDELDKLKKSEMRGPPSKDAVRRYNNLAFLANLLEGKTNYLKSKTRAVDAINPNTPERLEYMANMLENAKLRTKMEKRHEEIRRSKGIRTKAQEAQKAKSAAALQKKLMKIGEGLF